MKHLKTDDQQRKVRVARYVSRSLTRLKNKPEAEMKASMFGPLEMLEGLDQRKMMALYADVSPEGTVTGPRDISKAEAVALLGTTRRNHERIELFMPGKADPTEDELVAQRNQWISQWPAFQKGLDEVVAMLAVTARERRPLTEVGRTKKK